MSRRNQNKNNSFINSQYQYGHYPNMVWHAPHAAYQTEHYDINNDYNYYTTGKFKRRFNNSNVSQNAYYSNQNYGGHVSYDNMPYSNWRYRNSVSNTSQHKDRRKRDLNYDNTSFMTNGYHNYNSNPNSSNDRQLVEGRFLNKSKQAEISKQEAAHSDDSAWNTISTGNAINVDKMERPSTRIISKKSLKENAHLPNKLVKQTVLAPLAPALHYTDYYWLKHRESGVDDDEEFVEPEDPCYVLETRKKKMTNVNENQNTIKAKHKKQRPEIKKTNEFEKKVIKMLTAPVEMSKGRSLLEKMGWKGGGLGKDGEGIVEPIAPTLYYVGTSMGLGQLTEEDEKPDFVDHVYLRTLKIILDFVKNDLEKELKFDTKLTPMERKRIHRTVQEMMDGVEKFPEPYKSVIMDINHHNDYALHTESDGYRKTRHLTLYKEPHQHMYIVVPDDLSFEEGNVDCKVDSNKKKSIKENNVPETSQHSIEIKSEENEAMEDIICIDESNNVVENVQIPQDKLMVMNEENIIRLENEVMVKDSNLIEEISNVVDDVGITQSKSTLTKEDTISQSENEVMENDNTFTEESSCIVDDVVITQEESTFMEGKKISQLENKLNIDDNDDVNDRDGILNTIGDIENEELDKDSNIENLSSQDKEHNQETTQDGKLIKNDQENVQNIHENESNVYIDENNSIVKPGQKKLTKKQIRKLRAAEKIKVNKINNVTAKNVIHIKKKENNKKEVSEILDTIIKYFIEYTKDPLVTEFRFLGPFDYKERCAIKMFFEVCKGRHVIDKSKDVLELFDSDDFYQKLRQDNNGRDVIYKIRKDTYRLE